MNYQLFPREHDQCPEAKRVLVACESSGTVRDAFIRRGHDASKRTGLWLINLPKLEPTSYVEPRLVCCGITLPDSVEKYGCPNCLGEKTPKPRWANQTDSGQNRLAPGPDRWKKRSATYSGLAEAFAEQWGNL